MTGLAEHYTAVYGVIEGLQAAVDGPSAAVSQGWSQAAATFAALTQNSNNPLVAGIVAYLGDASQAAFDLEGRSTGLEELIRDYLATL